MSIQSPLRRLTKIWIVILGLLGSCAIPPEEPAELPLAHRIPGTAILEGSWLQTGYFDSIFIQRRIAPNALQSINQEAFAIRIRGSKVETMGTIFPWVPWKAHIFADSTDSTRFYTGDHVLAYLPAEDLIRVQTQLPGVDTPHRAKIYYRRMGPSLWQDILSETVAWKLDARVAQVMCDSLLVGTYEALTNRHIGRKLVLTSDYHLQGHARFSHFTFETGFGTMHSHGQLDVLMLYDSLGLSIPEDPPGPPIGKTAHYNWVRKGDTMLLTEFKTDNWETYHLGTATYLYRYLGKE